VTDDISFAQSSTGIIDRCGSLLEDSRRIKNEGGPRKGRIDMRGKVCASLALCAAFAEGQASPGSILNIDLTNATMYFRGYCTGTDQGQSPSKLTRAYVMPFTTGLGIADIVAVNGQPVKGTAIEIIRAGNITSTFTPGKIIGDITSSPAASSWNLTFLNPDATVIGTILIDGNAGGSPPPGAPKR
jgi:hypothetical protein